MQRLWRNNLDIVIASALLIASSAVAAYAYAAIGKLERPRGILASAIKPGRAQFFAMSAGRCVGRLETLVEEREKILQLVVSGSSRGRYGEQEAETSFHAELYFNPLGQLSEGDLRIESGPLKARLGSSGVNPINLTYKTNVSGREMGGTLTVPGPVQIRRGGNGEYSIESDRFATSNRAVLPVSYEGIAKTLSLEIVDGTEASPVACANGLQALNLGPLIDALAPFVNAMGRGAENL